MRTHSWKMAVVTTLLSLAARPALASDATSESRCVTRDLSAKTPELDRALAQVRLLDERVEDLEKRVDRLGVPSPSPAPTEAERKRQRREQERQAEFLNQIWTGP